VKKRCKECKFFATQGPRCPLSTGLNMVACDKFKEGRPYRPAFHGKQINDIDFDPTQPSAWSFWVADNQALLLAWELDHNDYGHFRVFLLGFNDDGVINKHFTASQTLPAFHGEVVVKGPAENDVWASYGFEDADNKDAEGNVVNKPREVKIYPARKD